MVQLISYLSDEGRKALAEASASVLKLCESSEVQATLRNGQDVKGKDYIVRVVPKDLEYGSDSPLLKVALDQTLLEIVAAYLRMWPRLHAVGAFLNFATEDEAKEFAAMAPRFGGQEARQGVHIP